MTVSAPKTIWPLLGLVIETVGDTLSAGGSKRMEGVREIELRVAVTLAVCRAPRDFVTATPNIALVVREATETLAGTIKDEELERKDTTAPALGAAVERLTVQAVVPPLLNDVAAQIKFEMFGGSGDTVRVMVAEPPLSDAVRLTGCLEMTVPAAALKLTVFAPDAI